MLGKSQTFELLLGSTKREYNLESKGLKTKIKAGKSAAGTKSLNPRPTKSGGQRPPATATKQTTGIKQIKGSKATASTKGTSASAFTNGTTATKATRATRAALATKAIRGTKALTATKATRLTKSATETKSASGTKAATAFSPKGLPAPINRFIGRERDLAALGELVGTARLVTLTGFAGIGKTRLGLEAARRNPEQFVEGTWFVDLAAAKPGSVAAAVVSAMSISSRRGRGPLEALVHEIGDPRILLFLDSCEHVLGEAAELVEVLLAQCSGLTVVATSCESFNLVGERIWRVGPLSTPPEGDSSFGLLSEYESVALFTDQAKAVRPDFRLNHRSAAAVADICRRLEGIPLALQLAASRLRSLSANDVLERLGDGFDFLVRDSRNSLVRHKSLSAAFEWSHDSLTRQERILFRRLSVFAGGFNLAGAETVCAGGTLTEAKVIEVLATLESKSLVSSDASVSPTRYRMLETIRSFAARKLGASSEGGALRKAHEVWCERLVEIAAPDLLGPGQRQAVVQLDQERTNLRSALESALNNSDPKRALMLAAGLSDFWWLAGQFEEGREFLERVVAKAEAAEPGPKARDSMRQKAKALWGLSLLALQVGQFEQAMTAAEKCLSLYVASKDMQGQGRAALLMGLLHLFRDPAQALEWSEQAAAGATKLKDDWCLAESLANCGRAHMMLGHPKQAALAFDEALEAANRSGEPRGIASALVGLGWISNVRGDVDEAEGFLTRALQSSSECGQNEKAESLLFLAEVARGKDENSKAREFLERGLGMAQAMRSRVLTARSYAGLARLSQSEGDPEGAARFFDHAILAARNSGFSYILARALQGRSQLSAAAGDRAGAREMLQEALDVARQNSDKSGMAQSLYPLAIFTRAGGDDEKASALYYEALDLYSEIGDNAGITVCLGALAGIAIVQGRLPTAARLFSLAHSLLDSDDTSFSSFCSCEACRCNESEVALLRKQMGEEEFEAAWEQGAEMSLEEAVEYATRGRGSRQDRATIGWAALTRVERDVVRQLIEGGSNIDIGKRLYMSPRTVGAHLSHIFDKLSIRSRKEVARLASQRES